MQRDDVGVLDLFQDADLPLDVFAAHATPAGLGPPLLDKLGSILQAGTLLAAFLHHCKLPAGKKRWEILQWAQKKKPYKAPRDIYEGAAMEGQETSEWQSSGCGK